MIGLLRLPAFRAFLIANCLERAGAAAMTVLLGLQVYELTGKPLDLGWLGLVEAIPGLTLVLYGGHVADRHSRRRIVLITSASLGLLAAVLAGVEGLPPDTRLIALFATAFLAAVLRAFENPAATGMEAQIVPLRHLIRGTALLAMSGRLADVFGPIIGGIAWTVLGRSLTYAAIAVLLAAASATLWIGTEELPLPEIDPASVQETTWGRIVVGIRYVFSEQLLWGSMALDLFAVFFGGANALLPVFATSTLGVGAVGLGVLRGAAGAGSLISSILATRLLPQRRAGEALLLVIAGFGVSMVVFGLSRSFALSLAALLLAGACDGISVVIRRAVLRLASPDALRGRIAAVRMVFVGSSNELGAFESGVAASLLGTTAAVWGGGLVTLAVVAVTALAAPRLRRLNLAAMTTP